MASNSVLIRVPATVGNFGGEADSSAVALEATLNVKVTTRVDGQVNIRYFGANGERVPRDRSNLVVRAFHAALQLRGREFTGASLEIYSSVPVAVGFGSSTAAILAGLLAADRLYHLKLDEITILEMVGMFETRQDNLHAAWQGGLVTQLEKGAAGWQRTEIPEDFVLHVVVPETGLSLAHSARTIDRTWNREMMFDRQQTKDLPRYFTAAENKPQGPFTDPLPPTCEKRVPGIAQALRVRADGLLSVFVCGSGPAIGVLARENAAGILQEVADCFARHGVQSTAVSYRASNAGAQQWNEVRPVLPASAPESVMSLLSPISHNP